jgi:predicted transcriptional regulator
MLANQLINNNLVPLRTSDSAMLALSLMEEFKTTHLPIVNGNNFMGLISENDIYSFNQYEEPIGAHPITNSNVSVAPDQHIYEVMEVIHENKLSLLPVVDDNMHYLGSIIVSDLPSILAEITGITNPGGIIVLEMNIHDYTMSEIAQIVETNNRKILNSFVNTFNDSTKIEVTLKLNTVDIEAVIQTFARYDYQVKATYTIADLNDNLSDRYNSLMNYLNI